MADPSSPSSRPRILLILLLIGVVLTFFVMFTSDPGPGNFDVGGVVVGLVVGFVVLAAILIALLLHLMGIPILRTVYPGEPAKPIPGRAAVTKDPLRVIPTTEEGQHVLTLEGIGPKYATRLNNHGVITVPQLLAADTGELAEATQATEELVEVWKGMGRLVQVKGIGPQYAEILALAGVRTVADLAASDVAALAARIDAIEARRKVRVLGTDVQASHVQRWVDAAKAHGRA